MGDCSAVDDRVRGERVDLQLGIGSSAEEYEEKRMLVVACIRTW